MLLRPHVRLCCVVGLPRPGSPGVGAVVEGEWLKWWSRACSPQTLSWGSLHFPARGHFCDMCECTPCDFMGRTGPAVFTLNDLNRMIELEVPGAVVRWLHGSECPCAGCVWFDHWHYPVHVRLDSGSVELD
mgnify:CR=1 FL=1